MLRITLLLLATFTIFAFATFTGNKARMIVDSDYQDSIAPTFGPWNNTATSIKDVVLNFTQVRQFRKKKNCNMYDQCSFVERFNTKNKKRWTMSNDYTNGIFFASWWSKQRVAFNKKRQRVDISVARSSRHGKQFASGELRSRFWHGYGCYEVRMKPANQEGLVTTFFSFTGKYDAAPGKSKKHNEVDIEFVYNKQYRRFVLQVNYFSNGRGDHEYDILLPFDPTKSMHNYAFKWTSKRIIWYVDGNEVYSVKKDIPKIKKGPHKIMMNMWPVSKYTGIWAGKYSWRGPRAAAYEAVRFTKGENCKIANRF